MKELLIDIDSKYYNELQTIKIYEPITEEIFIREYDSKKNFILKNKIMTTIGGCIKDFNNKPIANLKLNLFILNENNEEIVIGATYTDYNGLYQFHVQDNEENEYTYLLKAKYI